MRYSDIFVPGGFPRHTYNPRLSLKIEELIQQVTENLCKLVTVTGHTKSGKTVLVRKILPPESSIWIEGGGIGSEDDLWQIIVDQLALFQSEEEENSSESGSELSASGKAGANFLVAKGESEIGGTLSRGKSKSARRARTVSSKVAALKGLRESKVPLIIDDFHYLPKDTQGKIVRALKPLIFDGLPVVIIAIPHRRYDAIKVEREMTGRFLPIEIPSWSSDELAYIPTTGFRLLGGNVSDNITNRLSEESIGSPHLMQDFCRNISKAIGWIDSGRYGTSILTERQLQPIFAEIADSIGRPIFEKLARGPRQRSDRMARKLKSGSDVDIYGLVLNALAYIKPGLVTLEYEDLRSAIRAVLADEIPQLQEVARVLRHMAEIASTDQSSTPVIDFDEDEKRLHITDPFFAFYLRWGNLDI